MLPGNKYFAIWAALAVASWTAESSDAAFESEQANRLWTWVINARQTHDKHVLNAAEEKSAPPNLQLP
jgi:hypothetical protein